MSGPIAHIPGGYPPEFVDAMKIAEHAVLDYLKSDLGVRYPTIPKTEAEFVKDVADMVQDQVVRATRMGFLMGAQWAGEYPYMPIDKKPK